MPFAVAAGDSCLTSGGGFCTSLKFWWYLAWPSEIVQRTKLHLPDDKAGNFISINCLEFISIIINYTATYTVLTSEVPTDDPFPVLLDMSDNISATRWTNHACKESLGGRALGRLLCMLLVNSRLGINAKWLSTTENEIANKISRLKRESENSHFDFSSLQQRFQELKDCRRFQPSPELLSLTYRCVLNQKSPGLKEIQKMKLKGLGRLTT